jgi:tripartite-type tricarboxylate transporter receptor subunit TctC
VNSAFSHLQKYAASRNITLVPVFKPGAEGLIGTQELIKSPGDGYTLSITLAAVLGLHKHKNNDLNLIVLTGLRSNVMVMVSNPLKFNHSLSVLNNVSRGSTSINWGYGSASHRVIYEQYFKFIGAQPSQNLILYNGGSRVIADLIGGHIDIGILPLTLVKSQIDSGILNLVAIMTKTDYLEYKHIPRLGHTYTEWKNFDGVIMVAPKSLNTDARLFWDNFLMEYLENPVVRQEFFTDSTPPIKFGPAHIMDSIMNNYHWFRESEKK